MTIASSNSRNDYTAGGVSCQFAYTFKISDSANIAVYLCGTLQSSGYSVSGAGGDSGGTVTFTTVPVSGSAVALLRNEPYTQTLDLVEHGAVSLEAIEDRFDSDVMQIQQVKEITDRSLKFATFSCLTGITVDDVTGCAGLVLSVASNEQHLEWVTVSQAQAAATGSFTASGSGAVSRTVSSKLGDFISVMDFGAVGNDLADDTSAITNAIAAVSSCGVLYFPLGKTFRVTGLTVSSPLTMTGGATLRANSGSAGTTLLAFTCGSTGSVVDGLRFAGNDNMRGIDITCATNITVRHSTFDRQFYAQTIRIRDGSSGCAVEDNRCEWEGFLGADGGIEANAVISVYSSDWVRVARNRIMTTNAVAAGRVQRAIFFQISEGGEIAGNRLNAPISLTQRTATPIAMWGATGLAKNGGLINANLINGGYGNQIYVKNLMSYVTITGNVITNFNGAGGAAGIAIVDESDYCVVADNTIYNGSNSADGINVIASDLTVPDYCVITNNTVTSNARDGFSGGGAGTRVAHNVFRNNTTNQVQINSTGNGVRLHDNVLEGGTTLLLNNGTNTYGAIAFSAGATATPQTCGVYDQSLVKAVVIFNGANTNPITPIYAFNIAGASCGSAPIVTKRATGDYCVSFLRQFSCHSGFGATFATNDAGGAGAGGFKEQLAGCVRFIVTDLAGTPTDFQHITVAFYGSQ